MRYISITIIISLYIILFLNDRNAKKRLQTKENNTKKKTKHLSTKSTNITKQNTKKLSIHHMWRIFNKNKKLITTHQKKMQTYSILQNKNKTQPNNSFNIDFDYTLVTKQKIHDQKTKKEKTQKKIQNSKY